MPKRTDIKKIMVIGSGPIIIGQAAEFDYAGTQACLALKEEGYEVILANSNPATIMTDTSIADKVYNDDKLKDKLYIFDHHETALASGLNEYNNTNVHVELNGIKTCGTELYYNYLKDNGYLEDYDANLKIATIYEKFADLLNAQYYYEKANSIKTTQKVNKKITNIKKLNYDKSEYYGSPKK